MSDRNAPDNGFAPLATRGELGRRRAPRIAWEHHDAGPVLLEVQQPGGVWQAIECTLVDLGAGGSGLLVPEPLEPGARVRVTIQLPDRLGREPLPGEADHLVISPWTGQGHIVHRRHTPERVHPHVPHDAHRPHHHGVRFHGLEHEAERRLMSALYGPLPAGWAIECTTPQAASARAGRRNGRSNRDGTAPARRAANGTAPERYAVLKNGKRVAWGFGSYDRARSRAWSMHMDDVAIARRSWSLGAKG